MPPSYCHLLRSYSRPFTITFAVIALLLFTIEHINGRFWLNDFRVYYGAGEALLKGEPLYGVAHGLDSGVFKYAPMLAVLYALFALLPYSIAASIQYALITIAFLDGMRRIDRLVRTQWLYDRPRAALPLFLIALAIIVHLHRELHLGNINMMLLWLLIVALERLLRKHDGVGGLLLGAAILAKPHFVVLLPLLVVHVRWKALGSAVLAMVAGLLLPAFFLGWSGNLDVHRAWLSAMAEHNAALIYTGGDDYRAVNTIYSFLHRALLEHIMIPSGSEAYVILGLVTAAVGLFVLATRNRPGAFSFGYVMLIALVPSITLTDTEHFLLVMPLIAYLIHRLVPGSDPPGLAFVAVPLLLLYGGNFEDALGGFSDILIHYGVLGIGSFGLLILSCVLWTRSNHRARVESN